MKNVTRILSKLGFSIKRRKELTPSLAHALNELRSNELGVLANSSGSDKGPGYHNYTRVYNRYLEPIRHTCERILEIGLLKHSVQRELKRKVWSTAPSLDMWAAYFPNAEVFGFDIADFSTYRHPRCTIVQGDQSKTEDLQNIVDACDGRSFDIVIDDALHHVRHQQITMVFLLPHVKKGGYFFVEDIHFDPMRGEEYGDDMLQFLLRLQQGDAFSTPYLSADEVKGLQESIKSIRFFDSCRVDLAGKISLAVIEKL